MPRCQIFRIKQVMQSPWSPNAFIPHKKFLKIEYCV